MKKMIFTNGCFDLLHVGHIKLLESCKKLKGYVIVGLNSDESIKKIKGVNRPIINQYDRKRILESIRYVDEVIIFNEETPINLIKKIKPYYLVKGSDYNIDSIIGIEYCRKVLIIPLEQEKSTTAIIDRVLTGQP